MTSEELKLILKRFNNFSNIIDEQNDYYAKFSDNNRHNVTLEIHQTPKRESLTDIRQLMNDLKKDQSSLYDQYKLVRQLACYQDILNNERSLIRIEKRYDEMYFEYDKLVKDGVKVAQSLIDAIIRS